MISNSIDWLSITFDHSSLDIDSLVSSLASASASSSFQYSDGFFRGVQWPLAYSNSRNSFLLGAQPSSSSSFHCFLELRGSFCRTFSYPDLFSLVSYLSTLENCNFTRLDLCLDDYQRRIDFNSCRLAGLSGSFKPFRNFKCINSYFKESATSALTCYFGSTSKLIRFYNAEVVHGISADRWELQLRDQFALSAFNLLSSGWLPSSLILGSISFDSLAGWSSLLSESVSTSVPSLPNFPSLQKSFDFIDKQVSPTLAVLFHALGPNKFTDYLFNKVIPDGRSRFRPYHLSLIDEFNSLLELSDNGL